MTAIEEIRPRRKHKLTVVILEKPKDPLKCKVVKYHATKVPRQDVSIPYQHIYRGVRGLDNIIPGTQYVILYVAENWAGWKKLNIPGCEKLLRSSRDDFEGMTS